MYEDCANCGACYNICPTEAISVVENDIFYNLRIDSDKCISCGKCLTICPVNKFLPKQNLISAVGAYSQDEGIIKKSSSGGVFYLLAEYILANDGVVFGAAFCDDYKTVKIKSTDEVSLEELLRSKYVESLVGNSFLKVKQNLEKGRLVLFCGCPCQVAGLKNFLNKDYDNLYTCDFSCGGLPSHKMYNEHLTLLENKYKTKITNVCFRPKTYGWSTHAIKIEFANGKVYNSLSINDPYFSAYIHKHFNVRDDCLKCKFANNHYSDIILADFWLYRKLSDFKENQGISLVITNSQKGEILLNHIKEKLVYKDLELGKSSYNMKEPTYTDEFFALRKQFVELYKQKGLTVAAKKMCLPQNISKYKIILKSTIKKTIKLLKSR